MYSWDITKLAGRILKVDLTSKEILVAEGEKEIYRNFLSGRGLNQLLLYENVVPETSSLDSQNVLLFGAGLLVGTSTPGAIRLSIDTKNFFSGGVGSANAGGDFARELKAAGIGTVMVTGKAQQPVYIAIVDNKIRIKDAKHIWGKTVSETVDLIRTELGDKTKVLCIGPAGENLVRGACVIVDKSRVAAKCGIGAVMGSKKLKAIAVKGSGAIEVAEPEGFLAVSKNAWEKVKNSSATKIMDMHGTLFSAKPKNAIGALPFRHYQDGFMKPKDLEKIDENVFKRYEQHRYSALGCPIRCRATYEVKAGPYAGTVGEAMEANTIQDFGYKLDINYPPAIIKANILCNEYGIDMDTVAESIAWAYECYEKGIIDEKNTNGLKLTWGNHEALITLIEKIAYRKDFGDILAEGVKRAAEEIGKGSQELAITMKGQDLYEAVRMPKGYGLGAALATRGGGHCSGSPLTEFSPGRISPEIAERIYGVSTASNPSTYKGKAKLVAYHERLHAVLNSLGVCFFTTVWEGTDLLTWGDLAELVSAATGWTIDENDLTEIGERIHTLERWFNAVHAGFDRKNDYPPQRFFDEPIKSGPYKGQLLDKAKFDEMLTENYKIHGWNKNGLPQKKRLKELGLSYIVINDQGKKKL
ncbi:putative oxidoreductase YdhV [subsurface metagenome]